MKQEKFYVSIPGTEIEHAVLLSEEVAQKLWNQREKVEAVFFEVGSGKFPVDARFIHTIH